MSILNIYDDVMGVLNVQKLTSWENYKADVMGIVTILEVTL